MNIVYKDFNILAEDQVKQLYEDVGWTSYTKDIKSLLFGIQNSSFVLSAWDGHRLVGLIRVVSDDYTICYIQDLLVMQTYRRQGIGKHLVEKVLEKYGHVRQMILTTDSTSKEAKVFYKKLGFDLNTKYGCVSLIRIKKIN
jgi:ribosomal protein S18 acetylase RimI-like enzyme